MNVPELLEQFQGKWIHTTTCLACKRASSSREVFDEIPLSVAEVHTQPPSGDAPPCSFLLRILIFILSSKGVEGVVAALQKYFTVECLTGTNRYFSPQAGLRTGWRCPPRRPKC